MPLGDYNYLQCPTSQKKYFIKMKRDPRRTSLYGLSSKLERKGRTFCNLYRNMSWSSQVGGKIRKNQPSKPLSALNFCLLISFKPFVQTYFWTLCNMNIGHGLHLFYFHSLDSWNMWFISSWGKNNCCYMLTKALEKLLGWI